MPITSSAKKALRQNIKRRAKNLVVKETYKKILKDYKKFLEAGKINDAIQTLSKVFKSLDKAAKTNVIKKGKASRLKSRLSKMLNRKTS
ncbi:MAG: 30S ribosomal protein S20 [Candidatus Liptonbacteria bacterium]|nr:30S ribosomal protein S20 [Candidatus Liptonbacteria bacterium]